MEFLGWIKSVSSSTHLLWAIFQSSVSIQTVQFLDLHLITSEPRNLPKAAFLYLSSLISHLVSIGLHFGASGPQNTVDQTFILWHFLHLKPVGPFQ